LEIAGTSLAVSALIAEKCAGNTRERASVALIAKHLSVKPQLAL